jgi:hypothetical protein
LERDFWRQYAGDVRQETSEEKAEVEAMIDRQGNKIIWECDSCDETFDSEDGEEFSTAWAPLARAAA